MSNYKELRDRAFNGTKHQLSFGILASNPHLVYHPSVNPLTNSAHYTIYDENSAVCCTAEEAMLLYKITEHLQPEVVVEIGSYAGWSSCHILEAMNSTDYFIAVDNFSECTKPDVVKTVLQIQLENYPNTVIYEQDSTEFLQSCESKADMIFIDGFHRDGKPLMDVKASLNCLHPNGVLILHDIWLPDVGQAHLWLIKQGFNFHTYQTDNYLTVYSKEDLAWCQTIIV